MTHYRKASADRDVSDPSMGLDPYVQPDYIVLECYDCGSECDEDGEPRIVPAYYGRSIHQPILRKEQENV